jgi:hypothetical protein
MIARNTIAALIATAALIGTAGAYAYAAAGSDAAAGVRYAAGAGFHEVVGQTHAVGTFQTAGDACAMTMVVGAANVDDVIAAPARVEFALPAGGEAAVKTQDGAALTFACTENAGAVTIAKSLPGAI